VSILALFTGLSANAFASVEFQQNDFKLTHSPVVCAVAPNDTRFPNLSQTIFDETNYAIIDWKTKLNQGLGKHPVWNIDLIKLPADVANIPDSCNILILFSPQPTNKTDYGVLGYTEYNKTANIAGIVIYYMKFELTWTRYTSGNIIYEQPIIYYSSDVIAPQSTLAATIRHELGHAFGLGHYPVTDEQMKLYVNGDMTPPSIMVPSEHEYPMQFQITPLDVDQIKSKYGTNGFGQPSTSQSPLNNDIVNSGSQANFQIPSWIKNNAKWWSEGQIVDSDFIKGIQYLIKQGIMKVPQSQSVNGSSSQIPKWIKTNAGWWASGSISDDDFVKGIEYLINNGVIKI